MSTSTEQGECYWARIVELKENLILNKLVNFLMSLFIKMC